MRSSRHKGRIGAAWDEGERFRAEADNFNHAWQHNKSNAAAAAYYATNNPKYVETAKLLRARPQPASVVITKAALSDPTVKQESAVERKTVCWY